MIYGPCGGVRPDGSCEMRPGPCAFPEPVTDGPAVAGVPPHRVPRVLTDVSAPAFDPDALATICRSLAGTSDAVLVGEHHNRPDFPPTMLAQLLMAGGARPWITLACRDRNRVVLEQELLGLQRLQVEGVLCVTGDGRGPDVRPDVTQVFDLDGPRLTGLAASLGLSVAVPESPLAPPVDLRPRRLVAKQRGGATLAVLNHVAAASAVKTFMARARDEGLTIPVIAAVAVYTDERSATALAGLPGLELDAASVDEVRTAPDPVARGIDVAVREATELLAVEGVAGVNLSGLASGRGWEFGADVKSRVGARILEGFRT
ncbi:methylenetetrahydrofolate reductase [uncultured Jatrophihabitans sp.]|uniref:methylenetetrahydrofolate reductase n=1 Tax=uncultured Jatrophihabitans sp. TaxID=1610747 RepID=UPI0035CBF494